MHEVAFGNCERELMLRHVRKRNENMKTRIIVIGFIGMLSVGIIGYLYWQSEPRLIFTTEPAQIEAERQIDTLKGEVLISGTSHGTMQLFKKNVPYGLPFELKDSSYYLMLEEEMRLVYPAKAALTFTTVNQMNWSGTVLPGIYHQKLNDLEEGNYLIQTSGKRTQIQVMRKNYAAHTFDIHREQKQLLQVPEDAVVQINTLGTVTTEKVAESNAKERLFIPTAYDDIDVLHPSVVRFEEEWNGYRYWMAATPYLDGDNLVENPHLYASNDLLQWVIPEGVTNPVDEKPGKPEDKRVYNSDTHLIYHPELKRLELYYREYNGHRKESILLRRVSTNGMEWSEEEQLATYPHLFLSPVIIWQEGRYHLWYINNSFEVIYTEFDRSFQPLSKETVIDIAFDEEGYFPWHFDLQVEEDGKLGMLVSAFYRPKKYTTHEHWLPKQTNVLFYGKATTWNGFEPLTRVMSPTTGTTEWDSKGLYRSAYIQENGQYIVFYSGVGQGKPGLNGNRGVSLSFGREMQHLTGINFSKLTPFYSIMKHQTTKKEE